MKSSQALSQLGVGWGMQGVHHLRAIYRHIGDAPLFFVKDVFKWWWIHRFSLLDVLFHLLPAYR